MPNHEMNPGPWDWIKKKINDMDKKKKRDEIQPEINDHPFPDKPSEDAPKPSEKERGVTIITPNEDEEGGYSWGEKKEDKKPDSDKSS